MRVFSMLIALRGRAQRIYRASSQEIATQLYIDEVSRSSSHPTIIDYFARITGGRKEV